jgi:hypothetical protein
MPMHFNQATRRSLAVGTVCAVIGLSPAAHAITDKERWEAHQQLTQAQDLKKQGNLPEALAHYEESIKLDPKLTTLTEIAELEEQMGKLTEAQQHWMAARDKAGQVGASNTKQRAEERLAALEKKLPHLTLQLASDAPSGCQVTRDGAPVDAGSLGTPVVLSPGDHLIVVKAPGHADASYPVKLAEGDNQSISITAGAATAVAAPPPPPPPKPVAAPPPARAEVSLNNRSPRKPLGIMVGAVGLAGIAVGVPLWYLGWRDSNSIGPTADRNLLIGQIATIGGGVLLATGVVLYATAPSETSTGLRVAPSVGVAGNATVVGAVGAF